MYALTDFQRALQEGRLRFNAPVPIDGGKAMVTIVDATTGEHHEKVFRSMSRACDWVTAQVTGMSTPMQHDTKALTKARENAPVWCSVLDDDDGAETSIADGLRRDAGYRMPITAAAQGRPQAGASTTGNPKYGFRLKAVREVLEEYQLDPTAELVKVLRKRRPVYVKGQPLIDDITQEPVTEPVLDEKTTAVILTDMQQYIAPKLKAVETRIVDDRPKTLEQIDAEIAALLAKRTAQAEDLLKLRDGGLPITPAAPFDSTDVLS